MSYNYMKNNVTLATAMALYEEEKMLHQSDAYITPDNSSSDDDTMWHDYQLFLTGQTQTMNPDMIEFFAKIEEQTDTSKDDTATKDFSDDSDVSDLMFPVAQSDDFTDGSFKDCRAAVRYEKDLRHKGRNKRLACAIIGNDRYREIEAMQNMSFCKKRGGHPVKMPKARNIKSLYILRELDKKNLIPESYRHDADLILEYWREAFKLHYSSIARNTILRNNLDKMRAEKFEREHAQKLMEAKVA